MKKEILELHKKGYGINKIAGILKMKKNTVKKIIDRELNNEITKKEEVFTKEEKKEPIDHKIKEDDSKIDKEKLNILLENLDDLLNLIPKDMKVTLSSKKTAVKSLRINEELYELVKDKAKVENISISDIVNQALLDYLNNK